MMISRINPHCYVHDYTNIVGHGYISYNRFGSMTVESTLESCQSISIRNAEFSKITNAMAAISLISFLLLHLITVTITVSAPYKATDYFLLNCGSPPDNSDESEDHRKWVTDTHYPNFLPSNLSSVSIAAKASEQQFSVSRIPYTTARIIKSHLTYSIPVSPGAKFLRLYFYPATYSDFNKSESFFSVTANNFTLLSNFSAFLTVSDSSEPFIRKEYVINVDETQKLNLTFSPEPNSYAFVNGIEIVSIPSDLYIRGDEYRIKLLSGQDFAINNSTAFETSYRFNVGGNVISSKDDTGMYRVWDDDENYVLSYYYQTPHIDAQLTYSSGTPYTAPKLVYTTSRTLANFSKNIQEQSLNWSFPLDSGFYYLFRLHFCEFQIEVTEQNYRVFDIFIGNQTAVEEFDVIQVSGGWRFPMYRDYVMFATDVDGKRSKQNVSLVLRPNFETKPVYKNVILNGLEIFKLSDHEGNLSVPNPQVHLEAPNNSPSNNKRKLSWHVIVVIIAGVIGGIAVFSILGFLIFRRRGREEDFATSVTKSSWVPLSVTSKSTQRRGGSGTSSLPSNLCRHFFLEEINSATGNFDDNFLIGHGGFGNVYQGHLDNGATTVAVKRLNPQSKQGVQEFETEIKMLSKLRHLHLVSLIGYCDDFGEMILVYDYMAHGTLRDHLYKTNNAPLPWKKRLEVCIGAAKGLHYLHTGTNHTIIHRDVKSTNILLDDKWVAKVSDFGLSKVGPLGGTDNTHVSTAVKGSFGYVDPEYYKRQQLTEKSDVYSFGVVLFEVLCGRPPLVSALPKEQVNLAHWASRCCKKRKVDQIIDPKLEGQIAAECLNKFAEIAYCCLRDQGVQRPSMGDVVWTLEFALQLQEAADNRGHKVEGYSYPNSPSFPLIAAAHTNISTDEDETFSRSAENGTNSKSSGTSITSSSDDRLQTDTVFSEIKTPLGR